MHLAQVSIDLIRALSKAHSFGHLNPDLQTIAAYLPDDFEADQEDYPLLAKHITRTGLGDRTGNAVPIGILYESPSNPALNRYRLRDNGWIARVDTLPWCNLHTAVKVQAQFDCYLPGYGTWGHVCLKCFNELNPNLGLGRGQILVPTEH